MKKLWMFSMVSVLGTAAAVVAHAEPSHGPDGRGAHHFAELDTNSDGAVTQAEFMASFAKRFDEGDANKDGKLTKEERQAVHAKQAEQRFTSQDKNGDGKLTKDELPERFAQKLDRLDANKDGALTKDELQKKFEGGKWGPHGGRGKHGGWAMNPDATVTKADAQKHAEERFGKLDANGDKKLTSDELRMGKHHGKGGPGHACDHNDDNDEDA